MNKKKILILGNSGTLGNFFTIHLSTVYKVFSFQHKISTLKDFQELINFLQENSIDTVVNCIVLSGISSCYNNKTKAEFTNTTIPVELAKICNNLNKHFIHFSSDAVFSSYTSGILSESTPPKAINIYGNSKLLADQQLQNFDNTLILRLPLIFGNLQKLGLIENLLYNIINHQTVNILDNFTITPLYIYNLIPLLINFINKQTTGLIHISDGNSILLADFVIQIISEYALNQQIKLVSLHEINLPEPKGLYTPLTSTKISLQNFNEINIQQYKQKLMALYEKSR